MRISDWSSDVCSSGLPLGDIAKLRDHRAPDAEAQHADHDLDRQAAAVATPDHGTQRHRRGGFIRLSQESGDDVAVGGAVGGRQDRRGEVAAAGVGPAAAERSEEHTSELQSLMRISYAVFCLKKKNKAQI